MVNQSTLSVPANTLMTAFTLNAKRSLVVLWNGTKRLQPKKFFKKQKKSSLYLSSHRVGPTLATMRAQDLRCHASWKDLRYLLTCIFFSYPIPLPHPHTRNFILFFSFSFLRLLDFNGLIILFLRMLRHPSDYVSRTLNETWLFVTIFFSSSFRLVFNEYCCTHYIWTLFFSLHMYILFSPFYLIMLFLPSLSWMYILLLLPPPPPLFWYSTKLVV